MLALHDPLCHPCYLYPGIDRTQKIRRVFRNGRMIVLQDGSVWEVAPKDTVPAALWLPLTEVSVARDDRPYAYEITNLDTLDRISARYRGRVDGRYTR